MTSGSCRGVGTTGRAPVFIFSLAVAFVAGAYHERWLHSGGGECRQRALLAREAVVGRTGHSPAGAIADEEEGNKAVTSWRLYSEDTPKAAAAAVAQLSALDPTECMRLGEEYSAQLGPGAIKENPFNQTFASPVTAARDGAFLRMAQATGTDKVTTHSYHYLYTRYLAHARFHQLNILEIGLGCDMGYGAGASLRLWRAYLPCSRISFVEYAAKCAIKWKDSIEQQGGGRLYIGSQDDVALLQRIKADAASFGGFDMIVDDGSHVPEHQQATLEGLWSALKPGGVYIIEDLHDHWKLPNALQAVPAPAVPSLPVPLFGHLLHLLNCHSYALRDYEPRSLAWCHNQAVHSQFRDVANLDCMSEACALVKGQPLLPPRVA